MSGRLDPAAGSITVACAMAMSWSASTVTMFHFGERGFRVPTLAPDADAQHIPAACQPNGKTTLTERPCAA
jgi:hypothetical protein